MLGAIATLLCILPCGIAAIVLGALIVHGPPRTPDELYNARYKSRIGLTLGLVGLLLGLMHIVFWIVFSIIVFARI